jgi:hypothetical protein
MIKLLESRERVCSLEISCPLAVADTTVLVNDVVVRCVVHDEIAVHAHLAVAIFVVFQNVATTDLMPEEGTSAHDIVVVDLVVLHVALPVSWALRSRSFCWPAGNAFTLLRWHRNVTKALVKIRHRCWRKRWR